MSLNSGALSKIAMAQGSEFQRMKVREYTVAGAKIYDFSLANRQGWLFLATMPMAGLATITTSMSSLLGDATQMLNVSTDQPVRACMLSQIAAYQLMLDSYFAYVSGPGRTCMVKDEYRAALAYTEDAATLDKVVFVIEGLLLGADGSPVITEAAIQKLATRAGTTPDKLVLLGGPTACTASLYQVQARVIETCMKKMFDLKDPGFDINWIVRARGSVPICPQATSDDDGMALANEAIMYGGTVELFFHGTDQNPLNEAKILEVASQIPSSTAANLYGKPLADILAAAKTGGGFDLSLIKGVFAPACVIVHINGGPGQKFGEVDPDQLKRAFRMS